MALYRVEFAREWITGRWGFTDRVFHDLKGRVTEPSRLENAWLVNFRGPASALGNLLTGMLNIQRADFRRFGTIFEITILDDPEGQELPRAHTREEPPPPPWERQNRPGRGRSS